MAQNVATASVPAAAIWLVTPLGFEGVFFFSGIAGLLATVATLQITEWPVPVGAHPQQQGFSRRLIERSVLIPSILEFLTKISQPALGIFVPLYAIHRGIPTELLPAYYLCYGFVGIGARALLGKLSDRLGRRYMIVFGASSSIVALLLISRATDIVILTLGGTLYGLATAAFAPSVMALAIDMAPRERLSSAMATYSMAFQLAQGIGSFIGGVLIDAFGYEHMYVIMSLPALLTLFVMSRNWRTLDIKATSPRPV
jgi:MFS family permease